MGPGVARLVAARDVQAPPRWRERFERTWGVTLHVPGSPFDAELTRCLAELESGLAQIDFPEVTEADRVAFLEQAVSGQVRRALHARRFDLALAVSAQGQRTIAEVLAGDGPGANAG